MKDWNPMDPRYARRVRIEAAVLTAVLVFIAGAWLLDWLRIP